MNKKIHSAINIALIVLVCLTIFAGCTPDLVEPWSIEEDLNLVGKLVRWMHSWIGSYGWTVVVFTLFLKVLMLPLDIWQRYSARKMAVKMQRMQPYIEEIDRRYGPNTQKGAEEKQKLFKKNGYSMGSSCLPMIVTMVVFFVMFGGLRSYSTYNTVQTFNALSQEYYQTYAEKIVNDAQSEVELEAKQLFVNAYTKDGTKLVDGKYVRGSYDKAEFERIKSGIAAVTDYRSDLLNPNIKDTNGHYTIPKSDEQKASDRAKAEQIAILQVDGENISLENVKVVYNQKEEGWLWIQNISQPDTWESIMPKYDNGTNRFDQLVDMSDYGGSDGGENIYNKIRDAVLQTGGYGKNGSWNGLMILPILSVGLSFLSMFISQLMEKKGRKNATQDKQQNTQNKMMMILMPLMMAYFGFIYTGAFAIYMTVNYLISIVSTVVLHAPIEKMVQKNLAKTPEDTGKASYMR